MSMVVSRHPYSNASRRNPKRFGRCKTRLGACSMLSSSEIPPGSRNRVVFGVAKTRRMDVSVAGMHPMLRAM